jgi:hypothetical protein
MVFLLGIVTTCLWFKLIPRVYESRAQIALSRVPLSDGRGGYISVESEPPTTLSHRIESDFPKEEGNFGLKGSVIEKSADATIVTLVAEADSPIAAQSFLNTVVQKVRSTDESAYSRAVALFHEQNPQLDGLRLQIDQIGERIKALKAQESATAVLLVLERAKLIETALNSQQTRTELDRTLAVVARPTELVQSPTLTKVAIKPLFKPFLVSGIALSILGGLLAILFA